MATTNFATKQTTGTEVTGTDLNEAVQQDSADSILKKGDSTALTPVTQAIAEAGSSTSPYAFSPQRTMQAVALPSRDTMGFLWSYNSTTTFDVSGGKRQYKDNSATFKIADQTGLSVSSAFGSGGVLSSSLTFTAGVSYFVHACDNAGTAAIIVDDSPTGATAVSDHSVTIAFTFFGFLAATGPVIPILRTSLTDDGNVRAVLDVPVEDYSSTGSTAGAALALSVPSGKQHYVELGLYMLNSTPVYGLITEIAQTNSATSGSLFDIICNSGSTLATSHRGLLTDTSAQIRHRVSVSVSTFAIRTYAYTFIRS